MSFINWTEQNITPTRNDRLNCTIWIITSHLCSCSHVPAIVTLKWVGLLEFSLSAATHESQLCTENLIYIWCGFIQCTRDVSRANTEVQHQVFVLRQNEGESQTHILNLQRAKQSSKNFKLCKHFVHFKVDFVSSVVIVHFICVFTFHFWTIFGVVHTILRAPRMAKSYCCCSGQVDVTCFSSSRSSSDRIVCYLQVATEAFFEIKHLKEVETLVTIGRTANKLI